MSAERGLPVPDRNLDREQIRRQHQEEQSGFRAEFREALAELAPQASDLERRAVCLLVAGMEHDYGYCLNVLGRPAEAEWYCRTAIELDPSRPNGFKNLGISFEARGEYEPAIEAWITGTRVYPEDPRSLGHLERLLEEQPHLERGLGLGIALDDCRRAVGQAAVRVGRGQGTR